MPVRRQQLHRLQPERADHDDCCNQDEALGISQTKRESDKRKRGEMFKMRGRNDGTVIDRGQRREDDEGECQPACNNGCLLDHRL